jgi:hypothetical protein
LDGPAAEQDEIANSVLSGRTKTTAPVRLTLRQSPIPS